MFAELQDVLDRYEGEIPVSKHSWVSTRVRDVEANLIGRVPSLAQPGVTAARLERAKILVCDKVLELYRNPDGATYRTQTYGPMTEARSLSKDVSTGRLLFSAEELRSVRLPRRRAIGSMQVAPWVTPRRDL